MTNLLKCLLVSVCVMQGILSDRPYCLATLTFKNGGTASKKASSRTQDGKYVCLYCVKVTTTLACWHSDTHMEIDFKDFTYHTERSSGGFFKDGACSTVKADNNKLFPTNLASGLKPKFKISPSDLEVTFDKSTLSN